MKKIATVLALALAACGDVTLTDDGIDRTFNMYDLSGRWVADNGWDELMLDPDSPSWGTFFYDSWRDQFFGDAQLSGDELVLYVGSLPFEVLDVQWRYDSVLDRDVLVLLEGGKLFTRRTL